MYVHIELYLYGCEYTINSFLIHLMVSFDLVIVNPPPRFTARGAEKPTVDTKVCEVINNQKVRLKSEGKPQRLADIGD